MIPKLPSFPTGNAPVKSISPDWLRRLWRCVEYAMHHPTGDNQTIVRHGEYLSAKGGGGDAIADAAAVAPAAGSEYRGPFAVSYDNANSTFVMDAGWADAIGRVVRVPRKLFNGPEAGYPFLRIFLEFFWDYQKNEIACEFTALPSSSDDHSNEGGSTIERERVFIAMVQYLADGAYTISQWQHGPIRISGRAW